MPSEIAHESPIYVDIEIPPLLNDYSRNDWDSEEWGVKQRKSNPLVNSIRGGAPLLDDEEDLSESSDEEEIKKKDDISLVIKAISELEGNIKWEAVTEVFKDDRSDWLEELRSAKDVQSVARSLVSFTTYLRKSVIIDREYYESDWLDLLNTPALSLSTLCSLLLELEEMLDPNTAFSNNWKNLVDPWREVLEQIEQSA